MSFDPQQIYQKQLDWLITMAKHEGFKAHAWHRAQELDKDPLFSGIAADLVKHMKGDK